MESNYTSIRRAFVKVSELSKHGQFPALRLSWFFVFLIPIDRQTQLHSRASVSNLVWDRHEQTYGQVHEYFRLLR